MKILIATGLFPPDIGGPATYSKLLADELPKSGIAVDVLSFGSVRHLPKMFRHLTYTSSLVWHARTADAIFAQDTVSVGFPALLASYLLGKPLIVRVPGDYAWEQSYRFGANDTMEDFQTKKYGFRVEFIRKIQKFVVGQADQIVVPSRRFAEIVKAWVKHPEKVAAIYNGVEISAITKLSAGITFKPKTIISAGRLVPGKGFEMLITAMNKLPDWTLKIAGDGPGKDGLQKLIEQESLGGRVTLMGRVGRDELIRDIAGSEIFALNTAFETFSFQVVESMAAGTPVIATKVGSLPELIDDGINGLLIEPNNEADFLSAVTKISSDQNFRNKLVIEAEKKSLVFSIEATTGSVKNIVTRLIKPDQPLLSLKRRQFFAKLLRYLFSGGMAAVTDLVLLYVFTDVFGIWYIISSVLAFLIAFVVSFVLQKFFTFQDHGTDGVKGQAAVYLAVTSVNLVINTILIYLLVQFTSMHYIPAQILTSIAIAIESYVVYGMFIFKNKGAK